jgi:hypothetical protein
MRVKRIGKDGAAVDIADFRKILPIGVGIYCPLSER